MMEVTLMVLIWLAQCQEYCGESTVVIIPSSGRVLDF